MSEGAIVQTYDRRLYKKCIKCRQWKPRRDTTLEDGTQIYKAFGDHNSTDGLQSICFACKNVANKAAREKNVTARVRHHTSTRCLTQLGDRTPPQFVANLEDYLGYRITALVKHLSSDLKEREGAARKLRDALNEGYHIDHIKPLSSFQVLTEDGEGVDWVAFRECWSPLNLRAIPAAENLAKGATYEHARPNQEDADVTSEEAEEASVTIRIGREL